MVLPLLKEYFEFVDPNGLETDMVLVVNWIRCSLQKALRQFHAWLKSKYYNKGDLTEEQCRNSLDKRLTDVQWKLLQEFWEDEKKKVEAKRNVSNCKHDKPVHTTGAKETICYKEELPVKLGPNYSELTAYLTQHQKKNGEYPNEYTMEMCEQVRERSDLMGISNRSEPAVLRSVLDDVFGGHHGGYERGQGSGYSRSLMKDTPEHRASRLSVGLVNARLQQLASENEDLKEKMVKQHEYSLKQEGEMREEMAQLRALVQISYF